MLKSASAFHAPAAVMGSVSRATASILAEGDPAGTARSTILFVNAESLVRRCPRSADSKSSRHMGIGCVEARALLEPGPSFCWGPALEGSTSPASSLFFTPGKVDDIDARCAARAPFPPPVRASATPPAPRADPAHSRRLAPPKRRFHVSQPRYSLLPSCLRRSSILFFYPD